MSGWQTLWTWMFGLSVVLFLAVEVVVVIGGAYNIGDMLRSLLRHAREEEEAHSRRDAPSDAPSDAPGEAGS